MNGFGTLEWENWLYGLFYAMIGGGASAVSAAFSTALVAPEQFNLSHPGKMLAVMATTFVISGFISGMGFLRTSPLPAIKTTTTTTTLEVHPPSVVKTVEQKLEKSDG